MSLDTGMEVLLAAMEPLDSLSLEQLVGLRSDIDERIQKLVTTSAQNVQKLAADLDLAKQEHATLEKLRRYER